MKPPVLLRVYRNDKLEGVRQFDQEQIVIGRNADVQLDLSDESVSPIHAVIEERDSRYYISDLGSQSGTFRNGEKVLDEPLETGDEIRIGSYRLEFFVGVPKPAAPPKKPAPGAVPTPPPSLEDKKVSEETEKTSVTPPPPAPPEVSEPSSDEDDSPQVGEETFASMPPVPPVEEDAGDELDVEIEVEEPAPVDTTAEDGVVASEDDNATVEDEASEIESYDNVTSISEGASEPSEGKGTFAPPSLVTDPRDILKPGKGTIIEVAVAWEERVISSHHYNEKRNVSIGPNPKSDIVVPLGAPGSFDLLKIGAHATVRIPQGATGELIKEDSSTPLADLARQNRLRSVGGVQELDLGQGEMIRIGFQDDSISVYVRYVAETPKPLVAPLLDLTSSEVTGLIMAAVVVAIFGLYMAIYSPSALDDEQLLEEKIRKAVVTFKPPRPAPPKKKKVVEVKEKKKKKVVRVKDKKKKTQTPQASQKSPGKPGTAAELKKKRKKKNAPKIGAASAKGGAKKTTKVAGANMATKKPDPKSTGLLSVFGSKGMQKQLKKAADGAGELQGVANRATGYAGQTSDREGDNFGHRLKEAGEGGAGSATVGMRGGLGTKGKGTGTYGYGSGGLGEKGKVEINVGGQEAQFEGSIDREAIRRRILANKRTIRSCYERALNRNPDLHGKIVIQWDIEEQGRVTSASVYSDTMADKSVGKCIVRHLRRWKFPEPPPDQIARVRYPFVFQAQ